jgi:hypothetical protein
MKTARTPVKVKTTKSKGQKAALKRAAYEADELAQAAGAKQKSKKKSAPLLLLGTRKGLFVFERKKKHWKLVRHEHQGHPVAYAMRDARTGSMWASLDHGHWGQKLSRSRDDGATWESVQPPVYPDKEETKPGKAAVLRYIWTIQPGGADEPAKLYLGTEPGGLFVTRDDGATFELVRGLWDHPTRKGHWFGGGRDDAGIHSVLVDPRDSKRILCAISCAGVFETTDGGATWEPRNAGLSADFLPDPKVPVGHDPHLVSWCASDPDVVWQQNHCGIFVSQDGARTWKAVHETKGPAKFGFPVAVDANDPERAWIVPLDSDQRRTTIGDAMLVMRTEDGGKSWKELRKGLPQKQCYDVVYRHALDLVDDTLCMGSTTGNVYWSDNGGDKWDVLGQNLPPVYSVRFA